MSLIYHLLLRKENPETKNNMSKWYSCVNADGYWKGKEENQKEICVTLMCLHRTYIPEIDALKCSVSSPSSYTDLAAAESQKSLSSNSS